MVECELPKLKMRVRFPLLAPTKTAPFGVLFLWRKKSNGNRTRKGSLSTKTTNVVFVSARAT